MKRLRLSLKVLGIFFAVFAFIYSSCKKDDDDECFSCTIDEDYTSSGNEETYKICKNDKDWEDYADTWDEAKDYWKDYAENNDEISCKF